MCEALYCGDRNDFDFSPFDHVFEAPKTIDSIWNQVVLWEEDPPVRTVIVDTTALPPKGKGQGLITLLWTKKIPIAWEEWAKERKVPIKRLEGYTQEIVFAALKRRFDINDDGITWFFDQTEIKGIVSRKRFTYELEKLALGYPNQRITKEDVAISLGGDIQELALKIFYSLGSQQSLTYLNNIPDSGAYTLLVFLKKSIRKRYPYSIWNILIDTVTAAADRLYYEYITACRIFILVCRSLNMSESKKDTSSSNRTIDLMLDLFNLSGIPCLDTGNTRESLSAHTLKSTRS